MHRYFTVDGASLKTVLSAVEIEERTCKVASAEGGTIYEIKFTVPAFWSQAAGDIMASKYARKNGIPDIKAETSALQVIERIVRHISISAVEQNLFPIGDKDVFEAELAHILVNQYAAFNSPVWFNVGLTLYGVKGGGGNYKYDPASGVSRETADYYRDPQASACFILEPKDSLDGIYEQIVEEMRVFRGGSGAGYNLSVIRGEDEPLSGGGSSSGLLSFADVFDRSAAAIKSGGKTRRSARMVVLDADHPDIEKFIWWKVNEEKKALALIAAGYPADFNGEAYRTVSGQNANNSVSLTDDFMKAVEADGSWSLNYRTGGVKKTLPARKLWRDIAEASWACADPGIHFRSTLNHWNCVPKMGEIVASNPCCFTADMLVDTSEGLISFAKLEEMRRRGEELPLAFSFDRENRLPVLRPIKNAWVAGTAKKLVVVTTERGITLRCTPEHRFLLRNGSYVEAQHLSAGDSLRKISRGINKERSNRRYISKRVTADSPSSCLAQARFVWEQARGSIPSDHDVHHRNGDPTDDRLSNLELVDGQNHGISHSRWDANPRYIDVDPLTLMEVYGVIEDRVNADKERWSQTYQRIVDLRRSGATLAKIAATLDAEGLRAERSESWSSSQVSCLLRQGYMGRKDACVSPTRWNAYVEENNLKGLVPLANQEGIQGKTWDEFEAHVAELRKSTNDRVLSVEWVDANEPVYDIEVEGVHNFGVTMPNAPVAHTIVVSNSEFVFPSNSACNLASINLLRCLDDGRFNFATYRQVIIIMIMAMETLVGLSSYPTAKIAENSYKYRPLGLGYANLGALLMQMLLPYDSVYGRAVAGTLTAFLTGVAYQVSAEMAERVGPFEGWGENRADMLRVIGQHMDAVMNIPANPLTARCSREYLAEVWGNVYARGSAHGFRNAQVTNIAPTGTISFIMDCDTTGIEPDFSLVKYKRLAGGGNMKIVSQSTHAALVNLYGEDRAATIIEAALGTGRFPYCENLLDFEVNAINRSISLSHNLDIPLSEKVIPSVWERIKATSVDDVLRYLDLDRDATERITFGSGTVEFLVDREHQAIFNTANPSGRDGRQYIAPIAHIHMLSMVQPFLSGSISKTVNVPNETTVDEIERLHMQAWKLGLKCVAIYRDGAKGSQPLSTGANEKKEVPPAANTLPSVAAETPSLHRRHLPPAVRGRRQKVNIDGMDLFIHTGEFEDTSLGEVFLTIGKQGGALRGMTDAVSMLISIALQYGVPLDTIVQKLSHTSFEPAGIVHGDDRIKMASSILDYVARYLGVYYAGRDDLAHINPEDAPSWPAEATTKPDAVVISDRRADARKSEKTGQVCTTCGSLLQRTGTCYTCPGCGTTTGCGLCKLASMDWLEQVRSTLDGDTLDSLRQRMPVPLADAFCKVISPISSSRKGKRPPKCAWC